ncbi:MAG: DUF5110 domain-containing protein [Balneolaceae bacterium]|nr:DUF5110 domain-containing protein [Balneolaceae bacterium]
MNKLRICALFFAILLAACTRLPDSPFYEVDGIVSIEATSLGSVDGWIDTTFQTSVSKISGESNQSAGTLTFPFYVRQPGMYTVWVLSAAENDQVPEKSISVSVMDEEGFLLDRYRLGIEQTKKLTWKNRDLESGDLIQIYFDTPGHYRVQFKSGGTEGFVIDKLHLTLGNQNPPVGFGYPETISPGVDPVLSKRDQRVALPPGWLFKPFCASLPDDYDAVYTANVSSSVANSGCLEVNIKTAEIADMDEFLQNPMQMESLFTNMFENDRGLMFTPPRYLQNPEFKRFPTRWKLQERADFREQIEMVANPRRSTYEIPFLIGAAEEIFNPYSDHFSEEQLLRWLQFSTFHTVMYLPVDHPESIREHISDETFQQITGLIELRHQLYPYIYSLAHLIRATGVKPLRGFSQHPMQFRLGNALLVAPIYEEGMQERTVYLPDGLWYRYDDGSEFEGGQSWFFESGLNDLPVFVKAGSIIPYQTNQKVQSGIFDELTIEIYAGGTGTFRLYEDDGLTNAYLHGGFTTTAFRYFEHDDYATFTIGRKFRHLEKQTDVKDLTLLFRHIDEPEFITAEEEMIERGTGENMWEYDSESRTLTVEWLQYVHQKTDFFIQF